MVQVQEPEQEMQVEGNRKQFQVALVVMQRGFSSYQLNSRSSFGKILISYLLVVTNYIQTFLDSWHKQRKS